jgi:hypothetical protein
MKLTRHLSRRSLLGGVPAAPALLTSATRGVSAGGYSPLNKRKYLKNALQSKGYQRIYSSVELAAWEEHNRCPANDQFCSEAVWFYQTIFLAGRSDMEQIAEAIRKVYSHAAELAKA